MSVKLYGKIKSTNGKFYLGEKCKKCNGRGYKFKNYIFIPSIPKIETVDSEQYKYTPNEYLRIPIDEYYCGWCGGLGMINIEETHE